MTAVEQHPAAARGAASLVALHRRLHGVGPEAVTMRTWTPHSERKQRQRLFVESTVDGRARFVAKIPLDPADTMVDRECSILSRLPAVVAARPRPVHRLDRGFVMTFVPARDFPDVMRDTPAPGWPALLGDALALAADLHRAGPPATGRTAADVARTYLPDLDTLPPAALSGLEEAAIGPTHGDLGPWNLRVAADGRIGLIDWEDYQPVGLPALDVLNVVLTAALVAFPDYREQGFDRLYDRVFHERNPFRSAADLALRRYAGLTGTSVAALVRLTPLFCRWMIRRIEQQGRPTAHLYYGPFAERFEAEAPTWDGDGHDGS
ncbi:phosphotransferase [Dactylosporangium sp. NPDC050688]|uniref:phosphotransferase n=1 Tax=Dactylosporangium sp. NPDC050688 TaxID=3157217 RepID=UPI0033F92147